MMAIITAASLVHIQAGFAPQLHQLGVPFARPRSTASCILLASPFAGLSAQGAAFRAALGPTEIAQVALARNLFHASWAVPLVLYIFSKRPRLFPMSISWTIRQGTPRLLNNALWAAGWSIFLSTSIRSTGGFGLVPRFIAQMFATGAIATIVCPLGSGRRVQDAVHWLAALVYMVDHVVMFGVLDMQHGFRRAFCACFALMAVCQLASKPDSERLLARNAKGGGDRDQDSARGASGPASGENAAAEWGFMLGEYGLFVSFLCGMLSGLR